MWSPDMGGTWKDITSNLPDNYTFFSIFQDPDHPDQVCVAGNHFSISISAGSIFQADDTTYHWNAKTGFSGKKNGNEHSKPFGGFGSSFIIGSGNTLYVQATLSNFFLLPFSSDPDDSGIGRQRVASGKRNAPLLHSAQATRRISR